MSSRPRLLLALLLSLSAARVAYGQCPPGMHAPYGQSFCVPGNAGPQYPTHIPDRDEVIESMTIRSMPDPMAGRVSALAQLFELQAENLHRLQSTIGSDPKIRKLADGWWEYFDADKSRPPAYGCAVAYLSLGGVVLLSEVSRYKEAVITFVGISVPRPDHPSKVTAWVDQDDGSPQKIIMLNYAVPNNKHFGAISLEVPTMDFLLDTMEDMQAFEISVDRKSLIRIAWKNGMAARDQLRECMRQKRDAR